MNLREAAQQALEALEESIDTVRNEYESDWRHGVPTREKQLSAMRELVEKHEAAITALRTAIEQVAEPVAWRWKEVKGEFVGDWVLTEIEPPPYITESMPLYAAQPAAPEPKLKYRRGTYVRCMESDELCRVWTTSIDGGAWVKWPDGSITTYTAEQMGQAFSLEQAAPGKPAGYLSKGELFTPFEIINRGVGDAVPLYEHPRQWVELTDDEARALVNRATFGDKTNWQALVYMVDAKLKEKNT